VDSCRSDFGFRISRLVHQLRLGEDEAGNPDFVEAGLGWVVTGL